MELELLLLSRESTWNLHPRFKTSAGHRLQGLCGCKSWDHAPQLVWQLCCHLRPLGPTSKGGGFTIGTATKTWYSKSCGDS